ncbi:MAG TPA: hypothetical protein VG674_17295 [Amycolatopsis sp.]|nr:hypothetical protein [Amycolatopsis sp.]
MTEPDVDALRGPEAGGAGVGTSDEVLALAAPALDFFAQWAEIWNARAGVSPIDGEQDVRERFAANAGIGFRKFLADADALTHAHDALGEARADADGAANDLFREWEGPAAATAKESFDRLRPDDLADQLDGAAQLIGETMTHVFTVLKSEVDEVLKLRADTVAGAPLDVAQRVARVAQDEVPSHDELLELARWLDGAAPGNELHDRLRDCEPSDHDYAVRAAKQWLDGPFATEFSGRYAAFCDLCSTATSAIDEQFQALTGFLSGFSPDRTATTHSSVDTPALGLPMVDIADPSVRPGHPADQEPVAVSAPVADPGSQPAAVSASAADSGPATSATDDATSASSFSDIGTHVIDPAPEHHPADNELGTAPGGDLTFDPLGTGSEQMPDAMSGFGGMGAFGAMGGLGAAPDQQRPAARPGLDVFDTRGSGGRISGSIDDPPGGGR